LLERGRRRNARMTTSFGGRRIYTSWGVTLFFPACAEHQSKCLTGVFSVPGKPIKKFLTNPTYDNLTSRNRFSRDDGFRMLDSLNPLMRFSKLTCRWHQIMVIDVPGPGQFWLLVSQDLANLGKSSWGIWPFSVSHLPGFGHSRKVIFWD
jgi:hypothetical protein